MNKIKFLTPMRFLAIVAGVSAVVMLLCHLPIPALFCKCFAVFCSVISLMVAPYDTQNLKANSIIQ